MPMRLRVTAVLLGTAPLAAADASNRAGVGKTEQNNADKTGKTGGDLKPLEVGGLKKTKTVNMYDDGEGDEEGDDYDLNDKGVADVNLALKQTNLKRADCTGVFNATACSDFEIVDDKKCIREQNYYLGDCNTPDDLDACLNACAIHNDCRYLSDFGNSPKFFSECTNDEGGTQAAPGERVDSPGGDIYSFVKDDGGSNGTDVAEKKFCGLKAATGGPFMPDESCGTLRTMESISTHVDSALPVNALALPDRTFTTVVWAYHGTGPKGMLGEQGNGELKSMPSSNDYTRDYEFTFIPEANGELYTMHSHKGKILSDNGNSNPKLVDDTEAAKYANPFRLQLQKQSSGTYFLDIANDRNGDYKYIISYKRPRGDDYNYIIYTDNEIRPANVWKNFNRNFRLEGMPQAGGAYNTAMYYVDNTADAKPHLLTGDEVGNFKFTQSWASRVGTAASALRWSFVKQSNGQFAIRNALSNYIKCDGSSNEGNIILDDDSSKWRIYGMPDGPFYILKSDTNKYLGTQDKQLYDAFEPGMAAQYYFVTRPFMPGTVQDDETFFVTTMLTSDDAFILGEENGDTDCKPKLATFDPATIFPGDKLEYGARQRWIFEKAGSHYNIYVGGSRACNQGGDEYFALGIDGADVLLEETSKGSTQWSLEPLDDGTYSIQANSNYLAAADLSQSSLLTMIASRDDAKAKWKLQGLLKADVTTTVKKQNCGASDPIGTCLSVTDVNSQAAFGEGHRRDRGACLQECHDHPTCNYLVWNSGGTGAPVNGTFYETCAAENDDSGTATIYNITDKIKSNCGDKLPGGKSCRSYLTATGKKCEKTPTPCSKKYEKTEFLPKVHNLQYCLEKCYESETCAYLQWNVPTPGGKLKEPSDATGYFGWNEEEPFGFLVEESDCATQTDSNTANTETYIFKLPEKSETASATSAYDTGNDTHRVDGKRRIVPGESPLKDSPPPSLMSTDLGVLYATYIKMRACQTQDSLNDTVKCSTSRLGRANGSEAPDDATFALAWLNSTSLNKTTANFCDLNGLGFIRGLDRVAKSVQDTGKLDSNNTFESKMPSDYIKGYKATTVLCEDCPTNPTTCDGPIDWNGTSDTALVERKLDVWAELQMEVPSGVFGKTAEDVAQELNALVAAADEAAQNDTLPDFGEVLYQEFSSLMAASDSDSAAAMLVQTGHMDRSGAPMGHVVTFTRGQKSALEMSAGESEADSRAADPDSQVCGVNSDGSVDICKASSGEKIAHLQGQPGAEAKEVEP